MKAQRKNDAGKRILALLKGDLLLIRSRFGVRRIALFGSHATGKTQQSSDIDILVKFKAGAKTFDNYMDLKFFLEDKFHRPVDLVIRESLRPDLKTSILSEAIYV